MNGALVTPTPGSTLALLLSNGLLPDSTNSDLFALTLNVRGPSLTRSISWMLMPWLLTSPGHQQPWYWLCRIGRFLSYLRKDFNYLCRINVEKWHNIYMLIFPLKNLARKELIINRIFCQWWCPVIRQLRWMLQCDSKTVINPLYHIYTSTGMHRS